MIGLIHNPRALRNRKDPQRGEKLKAVLGDAGLFRVTNSIEEIDGVAREFLDRGVTVLCSSGGDGSGHHILSRFNRVAGGAPIPAYLPLRSGTMNTIPNGLGIKGHSFGLLHKAVKCAREGRPVPRITNNSVLVDGFHIGFLTGIGLSVNFLQAYYEGSKTGPAKAAYVIARAFASLFTGDDYNARLVAKVNGHFEIDGKPVVNRQWAAALVATVPEVGLGIKAAYRGNEQDGHFHLRAGDVNALDVFRNLPHLYWGVPLNIPAERFYDGVARRVVIESDRPFHFMVDGDLHPSNGRSVFEAGPKVDFVKF